MPQFTGSQVADTMKAYGLPEPTSAEIGMFEGLDFIGGGTAIANYVNTKTAQLKAESENPLKSFLADEKVRRTQFEEKANQLYTQLQDTISAAPKLFGNLAPEQIAQYLAPITQAARSGSADLEGAYARRGIAGSSIEANALAEAQRKYQENVLATGLNLGLNTQTAQASAIQQRINQLFGSSGQSSNLLGAGMGQLSTEAQGNLQSITQLPMFLKAMAQQDLLFSQQQADRTPSLWDKIDRGINTASNLGRLATNAGGFMAPPGGAAGGGAAGAAGAANSGGPMAMGAGEGSVPIGAEAAMLV